MKTKKLFFACITFASAMVFASCSSSIDIVKRHYNDGYYIHVTRNRNVAEQKEASPSLVNKNISSISETKNENIFSNDVPARASTISTEVIASSDNKPVLAEKKNFSFEPAAEFSSINKNKTDFGFKKHFADAKKESELYRHHSPSGSDVPAIVLVLLCLFLPFIAVGLVDNWGTRFVIDLLLCLLFYLPGIIYAFIVCFA